MNSLPPEIIYEIVLYSSPKDTFIHLLRLNKNFYITITTSEYLLGLICKTLLKVSRSLRLSYKKCQNLLETFFKAPLKQIDFHGFATSGGFDENMPNYWVSNMYIDDGSMYCSRDAKNNINTAGVLLATQPVSLKPGDESYDYILNLLDKSIVLQRSIYPKYNRKGYIGLEHIRSILDIYTNYRAEFLKIICDETKEDKERMENEMEVIEKKVRDKRIVGVELQRRKDDFYVMVEPINFEAADNSSKVVVFSKVEMSREGNVTCPVETFMIFVSETYVDIEDPEFSKYDNILDYDTLKRICGYDCKNLETGTDIQYAQFINTYRKLRPVLWGKFTGRQGNLISVNLDEEFVGNYLYTKLINPENRMTELGDQHETTNIDCSYVLGFGKVIDLDGNN